MGYRPEKTVYALAFEDGRHDGLEVYATSVPVGDLLDMIDLALQLGSTTGRNKRDPEHMKVIRDLFTGFAKALVSWNLEDGNGDPVPATLEGLHSQDLDLVLEIIGAWMSSIGSVSPDLGKDSNSGLRFPEGSLPMEIPSLSLTN